MDPPEGAWNRLHKSYEGDTLFVCMNVPCRANRRSIYWKGAWRFCHKNNNPVCAHIWNYDEGNKEAGWNRKIEGYEEHRRRLLGLIEEIPNTSNDESKWIDGPKKFVKEALPESADSAKYSSGGVRRSTRTPKPKKARQSPKASKKTKRQGTPKQSPISKRPRVSPSTPNTATIVSRRARAVTPMTASNRNNLQLIKGIISTQGLTVHLCLAQLKTALRDCKNKKAEGDGKGHVPAYTFSTSIKRVYIFLKRPNLVKLGSMLSDCDVDTGKLSIDPNYDIITNSGWIGTQYGGTYLRSYASKSPNWGDSPNFYPYTLKVMSADDIGSQHVGDDTSNYGKDVVIPEQRKGETSQVEPVGMKQLFIPQITSAPETSEDDVEDDSEYRDEADNVEFQPEKPAPVPKKKVAAPPARRVGRPRQTQRVDNNQEVDAKDMQDHINLQIETLTSTLSVFFENMVVNQGVVLNNISERFQEHQMVLQAWNNFLKDALEQE